MFKNISTYMNNTSTAPQQENNHPQILTRPMIVLTAMTAALYAISGLGVIVYFAVAAYALRGVKESVQALCVLFLLNLMNHGIMPPFSGQSAIRWLVFFTACGRIIFQRQFHVPQNRSVIAPLFVFSSVILLFSVLFSYEPAVSISKIIMFTIGVYSIMTAFDILKSDKEYWNSWFFTFFAFMVFVSVPIYFTGLGYYRHGPSFGFQGILYHSQSFGAFLAPVAVWSTIMLFREGKKPLPLIMLTLLSLFFILETRARTALLAVLLAIGTVLIIDIVKGMDKSILVKWIFGKPVRVAIVSLVLVGVVINVGTIEEVFSEFTAKGREIDSYYDEYQRSRGFLIEASMENFRKHPVTGIGFGVHSNYQSVRVEHDGMFGIPIAASVEKGFLISATLEEIGIAGFAVFLFLVISIGRVIFSGRDLVLISLFLTCIFINIGEMIFFSFGGLGLYSWLLMGYATVEKTTA